MTKMMMLNIIITITPENSENDDDDIVDGSVKCANVSLSLAVVSDDIETNVAVTLFTVVQ